MTFHPSSQSQRNPSESDAPQISSVSECQAGLRADGAARYLPALAMPRWKRLTDIVGSLFGLIICLPLFLVVAVIIKATSRGPVFFLQERVGYLGQPFTMWKFRTMFQEADTEVHEQYVKELVHSQEPLKKLDRSEQIIPFGKMLRKLCIDELPQLINVLNGTMSLVGPRPDVAALDQYPRWQHRRFEVHPGMTGLWQVSGKNSTTHERMVELDIDYISQRSPLLDLKILLMTLPVIVGQLFDKNRS